MKPTLIVPLLLMFAACTPEEQPSVNPMAVEQAPAPFIEIEMPSMIVATVPFTLEVEGTLGDGETVYIARSYAGVGSGLCPRAAGGLCLDIQSPVQLVGVVTAEGGEAQLEVTLPPGRAGQDVYFQAVVIRGRQGANSIKSGPAGDVIREAIYGCTDPSASNYDASATIDDGSCSMGGAGLFQKFTWSEAGVSNNGRANAEAYCASIGATLARPESQADWDAIYDSLTQDSLGWWIDGHNNFTCGSAYPGSPKSYQYGDMYAPGGTPNMYTGCNCYPGETGLVVYRYNGGGPFDGCQGVDTSIGNMGAMDEDVNYNHSNIVGFICELPGVAPIVEMTYGDVPFQTSCAAGDYDCQAEQVCEAVTGTDCIRQEYTCSGSAPGSYYPVGTPGGSDFNFTGNYDFDGGGTYGNICCCDQALCASYDIRQDHTYCGTGHWYRVAETPTGPPPPSGIGVPVFVEMISGPTLYPTDCAAGDYDCQAKTVCESITGLNCIYQTYDCTTGGAGSYYPEGTPGSSDFNFAVYREDLYPYGNICDAGGNDDYGQYGIQGGWGTSWGGRWRSVPVSPVSVYVEKTTGPTRVATTCSAGDFMCQAQQLCESITGVACIQQSYDCVTGSMGSYYPTGTGGTSDFNFAYGYDTYAGYGNICDAGGHDYYGVYGLLGGFGTGWGGRWYRIP